MSGPGGPRSGLADGPRGGRGGLGVAMLVHADFGRAEQLARHWAAAGCPVVLHVDRAVAPGVHAAFAAALADLVETGEVAFAPRHRCEWGTWGLVAATQGACELMLARHAEVGHVLLASGACLPLRPVAALRDYLAQRPRTDFIESATTADVPWTVGGLSEERFTLRFPFAWRRHRRLFDGYVALQRRWGMRRRRPPGIVPHMGSQWWCLTRATLEAILRDPERPRLERFFRRVWIPDESYFQTLARRHEGPHGAGSRIESRSLTLSRFDVQGKPHLFYDDHLPLLRRSDCFVARKAWAGADRLWDAFLGGGGGVAEPAPKAAPEPAPGKIDRVFARAAERRTRGRPGLWMQGRFPHEGWENGITAGPFSVFEGFAETFEGWEPWLARATGARVHGHLFAPGRAEFEGRQAAFAGALSDNAALRDHQAQMFLRNLVWTTRGERQCFQFGPGDRQHPSWDIAKDPNAQVSVISGAWIVPLFRAAPAGADLRALAADLQRVEAAHLGALRSPHAKARVRIWTLAEFLEAPEEALAPILQEIGARPRPGLAAGGAQGSLAGMVHVGAQGSLPDAAAAARAWAAEAPPMVDLDGLGRFLQDLRNRGMHPYLMGDFPLDGPAPRRRAPVRAVPAGPREAAAPSDGLQSGAAPARRPRRPYLVR